MHSHKTLCLYGHNLKPMILVGVMLSIFTQENILHRSYKTNTSHKTHSFFYSNPNSTGMEKRYAINKMLSKNLKKKLQYICQNIKQRGKYSYFFFSRTMGICPESRDKQRSTVWQKIMNILHQEFTVNAWTVRRIMDLK